MTPKSYRQWICDLQKGSATPSSYQSLIPDLRKMWHIKLNIIYMYDTFYWQRQLSLWTVSRVGKISEKMGYRVQVVWSMTLK